MFDLLRGRSFARVLFSKLELLFAEQGTAAKLCSLDFYVHLILIKRPGTWSVLCVLPRSYLKDDLNSADQRPEPQLDHFEL
jgi:hypothetical protein